MNSAYRNSELPSSQADLLVRAFGAKLGLTALSLNTQGLARIGISDNIEISFEHDPERDLLHLVSPISILPESRRDIQMECLLQANLLSVTSGGPAYAIDVLENRFIACKSLSLENLNVEKLYSAVDHMAECIFQMRNELAQAFSPTTCEAQLPSKIFEQSFRA